MEEKMIMVESKYYGNAMRVGRKSVNLARRDAARMLGIPPREYGKMEIGKVLIPEKVIYKLMSYGFVAMITRHGLQRAKNYAKTEA